MTQTIRVFFCLGLVFTIFFSSFIAQAGSVSAEKLDYLELSSPDYPKIARAKGWEGTVILKALVEKDGTCTNAVVEKSSGFKALDESAVQAVKQWKFSPARMGNTPYASLARIPVQFVLTGEK